MGYLIKWEDAYDKEGCIVGREFSTPEEAADWIRNEILKDFNNGLSGTYIYKIFEGSLDL